MYRQTLRLPDEKVVNNIQKYENTTAASIPIALSEAWEAGRVKEGDLVCLAAFGSGFTWGELDEKRAVYAPSVQKLFAEQAKIGVGFRGTLADRLAVDERAEKAVESLFGAFLQTVLVETEAEAQRTVEYLAANNFGRITVLVCGALKDSGAKRDRAESDRIADLLGASPELSMLLAEVFPREMKARLVDSIAAFIETGAVVDAHGDISIDGKLFVTGKSNAGEKNASLLAFKRELRELEAAIDNSRSTISGAEAVARSFQTETIIGRGQRFQFIAKRGIGFAAVQVKQPRRVFNSGVAQAGQKGRDADPPGDPQLRFRWPFQQKIAERPLHPCLDSRFKRLHPASAVPERLDANAELLILVDGTDREGMVFPAPPIARPPEKGNEDKLTGFGWHAPDERCQV